MATFPSLPPGWTINTFIEQVPNPNNDSGSLRFGFQFFARKTSVCTDELGNYVAASGDEGDCLNQALSVAQSRTQQAPYNEAT